MTSPLPSRPPRVVAIGGGHGLSRTLRGLARCPVDVTAVVTVADDGGSSGRLRRDFDVLPPGDLRKALASLTPDDRLARWIEYRFAAGDVAGHSLGNLMAVALADLAGGDLVEALDAMGRLVGARGRVLPCTTVPLDLVASGPGGQVRGQVAIARSSGHERVAIEPADAPATAQAVAAVDAADLVVLGPGSLFTSIIPNLLVPGIARAVRDTPASLVLVANLREQPGETQGLDLRGHLDALARHLPDRRLDVLVAHRGGAPSGGGAPLEPIDGHPLVGRLVVGDLLDGRDGHDPDRLAEVLMHLLEAPTSDRAAAATDP